MLKANICLSIQLPAHCADCVCTWLLGSENNASQTTFTCDQADPITSRSSHILSVHLQSFFLFRTQTAF